MRGGGWGWHTQKFKSCIGFEVSNVTEYGLKTYLDIAHNIVHGIHSIVGDLGPRVAKKS